MNVRSTISGNSAVVGNGTGDAGGVGLGGGFYGTTPRMTNCMISGKIATGTPVWD